MKISIKKLKLKLPKPKLNKDSFRNLLSRLKSHKTLLILSLVLIIGLNYFSTKYFVRFDATDSKLFSISQSTKNIIGDLEDDIIIEIFFSDNTPPNLIEPKQTALDLLEEYAKESKGKIKIDIKNPQDSDFETSAANRNIRQIQYSEFSQDRFSVAQGYLGIAFVKGDDIESIPVIASLDNLEYEATSKILKLGGNKSGKIGFFTKFPEGSIEGASVFDQYSDISDFLGVQYLTEEIDLSEGQPIDPEEFSVVVIFEPKSNFTEREFFEIEQYALKGGRLVIFEDLMKLVSEEPVLYSTNNNLNDLISKFGIEVEKKVLLDESFTPIRSNSGPIAYPYWVLTTSEGVNSEIPPLNEIEAITFLWANPLKKTEVKNLNYTELITTTQFAWTEEGEILNIYFKDFVPDNPKKYVISYLIEGEYNAAYAEQIPSLEGVEDKRSTEDEILKSSDNVKVVVFGDADFISNNYINVNEQNPVLFLNLIDWLANAEELSSIRSKSVTTRPLSSTTTDEKNFYKTLNSIGASVVIVGIGALIIRRRKRKKTQI